MIMFVVVTLKSMIARPDYISELKQFVNKEQVKVITGIRRSGKSTVLRLLRKELLQMGIDEGGIIEVNFESFAFSDLLDSRSLYDYVKNKVEGKGRCYLLLDEIQVVEEWERAVNSFLVDFDVDIYITGSNSHLLSSELSTFLAGRYVEIPVYTLSFREFLDFRHNYLSDNPDTRVQLVNYIRLGGFPVIHTADYSQETAYKVVYDIYSSVILRDTVQRYKIRDVELLERVIKYAFDNIGNTFSGKNVADYFKSQQRRVDINTVYNYLNALEGAFILYRAPRYDIKGKELLKTQEKYYVSDVSLIYATMGRRDRMIGAIMENIVFLELKRRGYDVYVGKLDNQEIGFIAERSGDKVYVQVAYKLESDATVEREFGNLIAINDQYPKYVVTMDEFWEESVGGVKHVYLSDFLLQERF